MFKVGKRPPSRRLMQGFTVFLEEKYWGACCHTYLLIGTNKKAQDCCIVAQIVPGPTGS